MQRHICHFSEHREFLLSVYVYACAHVHVYARVCECGWYGTMQTHVCPCVWKPDISLGCCFSGALHLVLGTDSDLLLVN